MASIDIEQSRMRDNGLVVSEEELNRAFKRAGDEFQQLHPDCDAEFISAWVSAVTLHLVDVFSLVVQDAEYTRLQVEEILDIAKRVVQDNIKT